MKRTAPAKAGAPAPECPADVEILEGLSLLPWAFGIHPAARYWRGDKYDWRAAQVASWGVEVGSCTRCRRVVHWAVWHGNYCDCPYGCDRDRLPKRDS